MWIDVPTGTERDAKVYVDVERFWEHIEDGAWEWASLPAVERIAYSTVCGPGLISVTPAVLDAYELIGLEGFAEAYSALPYKGSLLEQPAGLLEAWGVIRQTRNQHRLREMREKQLAIQRLQGGGDGRNE